MYEKACSPQDKDIPSIIELWEPSAQSCRACAPNRRNRNSSEGDKKAQPGLGPKLSHSMVDSSSSGLIPDGKGIWMGIKKLHLLLQMGSYTLCTTRVAEKDLTWAEDLIIRISEINSMFKQREKSTLDVCLTVFFLFFSKKSSPVFT